MAKQPHCHSIALCFNLIARFKIGHTPRKNRLNAATSRFIAYLSQSRLVIIAGKSRKSKPFWKDFFRFSAAFPVFPKCAASCALRRRRPPFESAKTGAAEAAPFKFRVPLSAQSVSKKTAGSRSCPPFSVCSQLPAGSMCRKSIVSAGSRPSAENTNRRSCPSSSSPK